jgi:uncharacterized linocin/CFP29 family protein
MSATPTTTMTDALGWTSTIWDKLKQAVYEETRRTKIAQKILPVHMALPKDCTVPSEEIDKEALEIALEIREGNPTNIIETTVQFAMTNTQVQPDQPPSTALTLATRAANRIAIAQDLIVFQGSKVIQHGRVKLPNSQEFVQAKANGNDGKGLLGEDDRNIKPIEVRRARRRTTTSAARSTYGENTFAAVAEGIADLQGDGHYGPYALVLHSETYADTYAPLENTLIMPADRIMHLLVENGFYGTGTLPEKRGVLLSLGGNTMDLAVGYDATPEFISYTPGNSGGTYFFQARERFALRLKDKKAVRRLVFL